MISQKPFLVK